MDSDSDSDTVIARDKNDWYQRLLQVQEQMRQLEEQIRVLVEESVMRKRRRIEGGPQASTPVSFNTPANRQIQAGQAKRVRKSQPQGGASVGRAKKAKAAAEPPAQVPVPPVAAPVAPVPVRFYLCYFSHFILTRFFFSLPMTGTDPMMKTLPGLWVMMKNEGCLWTSISSLETKSDG